ncbi:MAG TPA: DUF1844 domain-containing protein [Gemmatimonadota bacterium]|nr:DUF1844 domain-containing protein [Gemmatimonadota bacterium]
MSEREPDPGFSVVDRRRRGEEEPSSAHPVAPPAATPPRSPAPPPTPRTVVAPSAPPVGGPGGVPKADLTSLLVMLYGDAMANLGQAPDPMTGRPHVDLDQARFAIDLLAMLQEKTGGNRTPDESAVLEEMLSTLRMGFVRLSQGRHKER